MSGVNSLPFPSKPGWQENVLVGVASILIIVLAFGIQAKPHRRKLFIILLSVLIVATLISGIFIYFG